MDQNNNKSTVAIVGGGSSGLVAAKYACEYGLIPTIFEKRETIGGLWSPKNTDNAVWDGLQTNVTNFFMAFSDHSYNESFPMFSTNKECFDYFSSYMKKNDLEKYVKYNSPVTEAKLLDDQRWSVKYGSDNRIETFDFLISAAGLHEKPNIPEFEGQNEFKGLVLHTDQFRLNDQRINGKKVVVLGNSYSGVDVSQNCVDLAESVVNIFKRPYMIARRLTKMKTKATENKKNIFNIIPIDHAFFRREVQYQFDGKNEEESKVLKQMEMNGMNFEQANKELSHPDLFYDVNDEGAIRLAIADNYWSYVKEKKIIPKRDNIKKVTSNGVYTNDGTFYECDVLIYATGYKLGINFFDEKTQKLIEYDPDNYKMPYLQYKLTLHPNLPTLGFLCQNEGIFFSASELQAKWLAMLFSGKKAYPPKEDMIKEIDRLREKRKSKSKEQYVYGEHIAIIDMLAKECDALPDFDLIKEKDPELYKYLWERVTLSIHFTVGTKNEEFGRKLMKRLDDIYNQEYEFDHDDLYKHESITLLAEKFCSKPNQYLNMNIYKT